MLDLLWECILNIAISPGKWFRPCWNRIITTFCTIHQSSESFSSLSILSCLLLKCHRDSHSKYGSIKSLSRTAWLHANRRRWPKPHVLFNREKPPCDTASKNKIKSILRGDGATQIREIWITRSSWSLMDPISHTRAG